MTIRIMFANHKGGAGKTATTVNLAAALADDGYNVLVVDLDPQANATRRLGFHMREWTQPSVSEAIHQSIPGFEGIACQAITESGWPDHYGQHVHLIPSRFDLENRISEAATVGAVGRLRRALGGRIDKGYEFVLIDCPPSLGHLTQLAMAASDYVVGVLEPEYDAVEGGLRLREFVANAAADLGNRDLRLLGYVVGRVRSQLGAHSYQIDGLADAFSGSKVWAPHVPERAVIKDAADASLPLSMIGSVKARDTATIYADLAHHLIDETGQ